MRPTSNAVHYDQVLTGVSVNYTNTQYIADKIFPMVNVPKQSDRYYVFEKADQFRNNAKLRAPGTESDQVGFGLSTDTFFCDEFAVSTVLEDEVRDNADSVLRIETAKTNFVTNNILLKWEYDVATFCCNTGIWTNSTPTNLWDDYVNSDPIDDLETAIDAIEGSTGQPVNKIVISYNVWKKLKHHPQLLERMPSTGIKTATLDLLKAILGVDQIEIGSAIYNSAKQGQAAVYTRLWNKDVWLGHVAPTPGIETPTAGYTFVWPRNGQVRGIRRWREEKKHSDIIEGFMCYDLKAVGTDLGYLLNNVIS